jgi:hypothetical protein
MSGPVYPNPSTDNSPYLSLGSSGTVVPVSLYRVLRRQGG